MRRGQCLLSYNDGQYKVKDKGKDKDVRSSKKNVYRLRCPLVHDTHCPHEDKDKEKARMLNRPNMCCQLFVGQPDEPILGLQSCRPNYRT